MKKSKRKKNEVDIITYPISTINHTTLNNTSIFTTNHIDLIINQAIILHSKGKIKEAEEKYKEVIDVGNNQPIVYNNYGLILRENGNLKKAEELILKAIYYKNDYADAYSNLGIISIDLGKLKEAEKHLKKAIELNPLYTDAYINLASLLKDTGKLNDSELYIKRAINLNSNNAISYSILGGILEEIGKEEEAFEAYQKAINLSPTSKNYELITNFLKQANHNNINQKYSRLILHKLFKRDDINHNKLIDTFNSLFKNKIKNFENKEVKELLQDQSFLSFIHDKLVILALGKINFTSLGWEILLTKVRKYICNQIHQNAETISFDISFIIGIAEQCFINEYIFSSDEKENEDIEEIINRCETKGINKESIAIIGCYSPLYKIDKLLKSYKSNDFELNELIKHQLSEPLEEKELAKKIKKIGLISNDISKTVKDQYEENPYPRWKNANPKYNSKFSAIEVINSGIKPNFIKKELVDKTINVLVAGCGTGQHILNTLHYKNGNIKGIDLSAKSLAYAQRKLNEMKIKNVELLQMDLLDVSLLEEKYDIIESSGVLHHMDDPSKGLKALLEVLKKDGFMKLGLYSELARKDVIRAIEYIKSNKLEANLIDLKSFRKDVISKKFPEIIDIHLRRDFYTTSECRDLCFHSKEHRYTIPKLKETFKKNNLKFHGFLLPTKVKAMYKNIFPEDQHHLNLSNWEIFENQYPNTFRRMYQFWISKNNILA